MSGKLYVVPTPIGNLEDITLRALRVLKEVDLVLAEDTRVSLKLLNHFEISVGVYAYHLNNEHHTTKKWIDQLKEGKQIALVSDAGTPAISDPGFLLVRASIAEGVEVECLPGATAFVPALVMSGLPCDRFVFEGFLPPKKGRVTRLEHLAAQNKTVVFYESPHKILKTLKQCAEIFGADRPASISRELTKMYEETLRGSLTELIDHFEETAPRGEFVLVIGPEGKMQH
ncbi:MAG: 16S rRNA (cytidine(1402)-2'-O)-methyltransferase [Flavobacteriaceae bacterium]|jgi:16S rRNA (cytidine1402-2'-O)-methyltransferase|nr:16S rRNA (cytidine(1402)-2'-O)-methyltransferase [Flavobacteriaceae bacterium]PTM04945.1 MAG: 16S rRNA (cytidine(1402)-2'-O)-methyltransferase [Bacteroidota bacterium]